MNRLKPRPTHLRLGLYFVITLLWVSTALPTFTEPLTEDELKYDPDVEAQTDKTGSYRIEVGGVPLKLFYEFHHREGTLTDPSGAKKQAKVTPWLAPDKKDGQENFSFEVLVPEDYSRERPAGLLVCINAWDTGNYAAQFHEAAAKANLIVIGANDSGNKRGYPIRMTLATYATELIKRRYAIDPERVYLTGYSGGAGAGNTLVYYKPELFKGAVLMCGSAMLTAGGKYGTLVKSQPTRDQMRILTRDTRFYVITGTKDSALDICKATAENWKSNGFQRTHIEIIDGLPHKLPQIKAEDVKPAFAFLDAPLVRQAMDAFDDAKEDLKRNRLEDALKGFQIAATRLMLSDDPKAQAAFKEAKEQADSLNAQYESGIATLEQAIAAKDDKAATAALRDLQRAWRDRLGREGATEYRKQILEVKRGG